MTIPDYIMMAILIMILLIYTATWIIFFIKMWKLHKETIAVLDKQILFYNKIIENYKEVVRPL